MRRRSRAFSTACSGEDHDRHKQQQQRDDLGAERTERRDQRHAEQTAEQARAAALLPVRIKGEQLLPEGEIVRSHAEHMHSGTQEENDGHDEQDFRGHSAVTLLQRRHNGYVEQENRPENGAHAEKPEKLAVQPGPDALPGDEHKAGHENGGGKQHHGKHLVALLRPLQIAEALLFPLRLRHLRLAALRRPLFGRPRAGCAVRRGAGRFFCLLSFRHLSPSSPARAAAPVFFPCLSGFHLIIIFIFTRAARP